MEPPGQTVKRLAAGATDVLVICAPFVKQSALTRLLSEVSGSVAVSLYTRWRPEEVAAGVSDLGVLEDIEGRGGVVWLCDRLHAKHFRADDDVLMGSANVTLAALGWSAIPNIECLLSTTASDPTVLELESQLSRERVRATNSIAQAVMTAAALLPRVPRVDERSIGPPDGVAWFPRLRMPEDLFRAYTGGPEALSADSGSAAASDLIVLDIPPGLDEPQFAALVAARLLQQPLVQELDEFLATPQRFGAVRDHLRTFLGLEREESSVIWQTTMRWLLFFVPARFARAVPSHSEIMMRRERGL